MKKNILQNYFLKTKINQTMRQIFREKRSTEEQLFDQDTNEEEDFEIPAFLRKQKF